jgi:hypothetical protein
MLMTLLKSPPAAKLAKLGKAHPELERLRELFGLRGAADLIRVDAGNLKRFLDGKPTLGTDALARAIDVDHVLARAAQVFVGTAIIAWLTGHSQRFAGARPIDVLTADGPGPLLDELERIREGGYA